MTKRNKGLKKGFLEGDLLINNFYSEVNHCKPKKTVSRFMVFGLFLVVALVSGIGILSMLAAPGDPIDIGISVHVLPLPTATISATPNPIPDISSVSLLSWSSTDATTCIASGDWSGAQAISGSQSIGPFTTSKTYTITCSGSGGTSAPATVVVNVNTTTPTVSPSVPAITSFTATPNSVNPGVSSNLNWTSTNTTSCTASTSFGATDWTGSVPVNSTPGTFIVTPPSTPGAYTYLLDCNGATSSVVINVSALPTVSLNSDKTTVNGGDTATLTWTTSNITSCTASTIFGATDWNSSSTISIPSGNSYVVLPDTPGSYVYALTCNGVIGSVSIDVALPPSITDFSSDKLSATPSASAKLSWQSNNATSCSASTLFGATDWVGAIGLTGEEDIVLPDTEGNYQYKITCSNAFGSASKTVNIVVSSAVTPVTNPITPEEGPSYTTFGNPGDIEISIAVSDDEIPVDYSGKLSIAWQSKEADKCIASGVSGWSGDKAVSGSSPLQNPGQIGVYTYVLTCENNSGQKTIAYAKISVIESSKIEGLVDITERELTTLPSTAEGAGEAPIVTAPLSDVLEKTGIIQAFSVSSTKSPWQNAETAVVLLAIAGLIGMGLLDLYWSRKNRGLVFNSQNNMPITDAKIELRKTANDQILQTILTDHKGRFKFRLSDLKDGEYYVNVSKVEYSFPSKLFVSKNGADKNIYLGKTFKLIKKNGLRLKIPVDPAISK